MCLCARVSVCMFACLFTPFFAQWMNKLWTITLHLCFNFVLWIVKKWFYAPHQSIWNVCIMQIHVSTINCVTRALRSVGDWACVFEQCTCSAKNERTTTPTGRYTMKNQKRKRYSNTLHCVPNKAVPSAQSGNSWVWLIHTGWCVVVFFPVPYRCRMFN